MTTRLTCGELRRFLANRDRYPDDMKVVLVTYGPEAEEDATDLARIEYAIPTITVRIPGTDETAMVTRLPYAIIYGTGDQEDEEGEGDD